MLLSRCRTESFQGWKPSNKWCNIPEDYGKTEEYAPRYHHRDPSVYRTVFGVDGFFLLLFFCSTEFCRRRQQLSAGSFFDTERTNNSIWRDAESISTPLLLLNPEWKMDRRGLCLVSLSLSRDCVPSPPKNGALLEQKQRKDSCRKNARLIRDWKRSRPVRFNDRFAIPHRSQVFVGSLAKLSLATTATNQVRSS